MITNTYDLLDQYFEDKCHDSVVKCMNGFDYNGQITRDEIDCTIHAYLDFHHFSFPDSVIEEIRDRVFNTLCN